MFPVRDVVKRRTFPFINIALILINSAVFVASLSNFEEIIVNFGFVPAEFTILTIFTSMFLHGGIDHLIGNMWYLFIFGDNVEDRFGHLKYLVLYLVFGVSAVLMQYLIEPISQIPMIGASGAISGVMGAYLILFPKVRVEVILGYILTAVPAFMMVGIWFALQILFGTTSLLGGVGSGIAYWAHIGGFVAGLLAGLGLRRLGKQPAP